MPPAAGAAGASWLLPATLGALGIAQAVQSNVSNKATIKNAENASNNARQQVGQNQDAAMQRLGQYNQANPGPAAAGANAAPVYSGTQIPIVGQQQHTQMQGGLPQGGGQGMMSGGPGMSAPGADGILNQLTPQQLSMLINHLGGGGAPQGGGMA